MGATKRTLNFSLAWGGLGCLPALQKIPKTVTGLSRFWEYSQNSKSGENYQLGPLQRR